MKIFYSPGKHGFYNEIMHGERELIVVDPSHVPTMIKIVDPNCVETLSADGSPPPMIEVADPDVTPPSITIPNPHCYIPMDAIEISEELYQSLLDAQSTGKKIVAGANGVPKAVDHVPSVEELTVTARYMRDSMIAASDWTQLSDIPAATKSAWKTYRQALRDVPEQAGFPANVDWPAKPA